MSDFPSGPWAGFYTYNARPGKHRTDLILTFANGRMTGEGNDSVGLFVIASWYDAQTKECAWTKSYVGAHYVEYMRFRDGKGICGTWDILDVHRGRFHIWPLGEEGEAEEEAIEEELPAELKLAHR